MADTMPATTYVEVSLTGSAPINVIVHRLGSEIISHSPMPTGWNSYLCGGGGMLPDPTASMDLNNPAATVYGTNGTRVDHFAYALAPGEAGVFYVQASNSGRDRLTWDLTVDVTVGNESQTLNLNRLALHGRHFVTATACGTSMKSDSYDGYTSRWLPVRPGDFGFSCT
jgi:hypothetical protein